MDMRALIVRGKTYFKVDVRNIDERQRIANEWFDDVLICLKQEFGESRFYSTIYERLLKISGFESTVKESLENAVGDIPLIHEMQQRVDDYLYRMKAIIHELNSLC